MGACRTRLQTNTCLLLPRTCGSRGIRITPQQSFFFNVFNVDGAFYAAYVPRKSTAVTGKNKMKKLLIAALLLTAFHPVSNAGAAPPVVCIGLPKAQLGQGNNSAVDVSEPVRTTLGQYMAGPSVQLVRLDARIPVQIEAEAAQKNCAYILQTTLVQKKKATSMFKKLAPFASALPMLGGAGGNMGEMMAAQAASTAINAGAQQDYAAAMSSAQQSNVKAGDTVTVEYTLTKVGATDVTKNALQAKANQDGEDLIGPMLEQVATAVLTVALAK